MFLVKFDQSRAEKSELQTRQQSMPSEDGQGLSTAGQFCNLLGQQHEAFSILGQGFNITLPAHRTQLVRLGWSETCCACRCMRPVEALPKCCSS